MIRPNQDEVEYWVGISPRQDYEEPSNDKSEWGKDHKDFVLKYFLPKYKPNLKVWRITVEAYLTKIKTENGEIKSFEEAMSDGSTIVPDFAYKFGRIKDPWAVAHDFIYILKKLSLPDVYGNTWKYFDSQKMYRDGWYSQNFYIIGSVRWIGLVLFGWTLWNNKKISKKFKKIKYVIYKPSKKYLEK